MKDKITDDIEYEEGPVLVAPDSFGGGPVVAVPVGTAIPVGTGPTGLPAVYPPPVYTIQGLKNFQRQPARKKQGACCCICGCFFFFCILPAVILMYVYVTTCRYTNSETEYLRFEPSSSLSVLVYNMEDYEFHIEMNTNASYTGVIFSYRDQTQDAQYSMIYQPIYTEVNDTIVVVGKSAKCRRTKFTLVVPQTGSLSTITELRFANCKDGGFYGKEIRADDISIAEISAVSSRNMGFHFDNFDVSSLDLEFTGGIIDAKNTLSVSNMNVDVHSTTILINGLMFIAPGVGRPKLVINSVAGDVEMVIAEASDPGHVAVTTSSGVQDIKVYLYTFSDFWYTLDTVAGEKNILPRTAIGIYIHEVSSPDFSGYIGDTEPLPSSLDRITLKSTTGDLKLKVNPII